MLGACAGFFHQLFQPLQGVGGRIGMERADAAGVSRIPQLEQFQSGGIPDFAHKDALGRVAHADLCQVAHGDAGQFRGQEKDRVGRFALEFGRVFQDHDAIMRAQFVQKVDDAVDEGGFAGAGAADDDNVLPREYGLFQQRDDIGRDHSLFQVFRQGDDARRLFPHGEGRARPDNGRICPLKTRSVQREQPFHHGTAGADRLIQRAGHKGQDQTALGLRKFADAFLIFPIFFRPNLPVGIEHDLNDRRIAHGIHDDRAAVVFQALEQPFPCGVIQHGYAPFSTKTATISRADTALMAVQRKSVVRNFTISRAASFRPCAVRADRVSVTFSAPSRTVAA